MDHVESTRTSYQARTRCHFTVGLWRNRFITEGLAGLGDEMRPGALRQIGDDRVERAVQGATAAGSALHLNPRTRFAYWWRQRVTDQNLQNPGPHPPPWLCRRRYPVAPSAERSALAILETTICATLLWLTVDNTSKRFMA